MVRSVPLRADTSSVTVADPLSPDWQLPVAVAGDPVASPAPRHLVSVPQPVPAAVFAAIADLVPAPRPEVRAAPVQPAAAPQVVAEALGAPVLPAPREESHDYELRSLVFAELRALALD